VLPTEQMVGLKKLMTPTPPAGKAPE